MKKMISLLLALALALTLCACVTPKTPMPIEDGDKSAAQPVTVRLGVSIVPLRAFRWVEAEPRATRSAIPTSIVRHTP